jgi:exodeoxyribonuclease V alpha subunit
MQTNKEVEEQLRRFGLGETMAERVAEELSYELAVLKITEDPYILMSIDGISFQKADKIALNYFSLSVNDKRRQRAIILKLLDEQKNLGHTYLPLLKLEQAMKKNDITSTDLLLENVQRGELIMEDNRVYTRRMYEAEVMCAKYIRERVENEP